MKTRYNSKCTKHVRMCSCSSCRSYYPNRYENIVLRKRARQIIQGLTNLLQEGLIKHLDNPSIKIKHGIVYINYYMQSIPPMEYIHIPIHLDLSRLEEVGKETLTHDYEAQSLDQTGSNS